MSNKINNIEAKRFRRVMGKFATGVTIITYEHEGEPTGMTANAFMSLSMDPPMVLVSIRQQSRFSQSVKPGDSFGIAFLREEDELLSQHFGGRPKPELEIIFSDYYGTPILQEALVQLTVRTNAIHEGGDHLIYTANVESINENDGRPLLFFSGNYKQLHALNPTNCWIDLG